MPNTARGLSVTMRKAVRWIHDGEAHTVRPQTLKALRERRIITTQDPVALTEYGQRVHADIMKSGDGPEDLKEMFNFKWRPGR
jgi:hypothetical protein